MFTAVSIVVATRAQPCEHCQRDVSPGERIAYYPKKPRGVAHLRCHVARRGRGRP